MISASSPPARSRSASASSSRAAARRARRARASTSAGRRSSAARVSRVDRRAAEHARAADGQARRGREPAQDPLGHQPGVTSGAAERPDDQRGRGRARVLVTDRALAEVRRAALAGLHRRGGARALLRRVGGRRRARPASASPASSRSRSAADRRAERVDHRLVARLGGAQLLDRRPSAASSAATSAGPSSARASPSARPAAAERGAPQRAARPADGRDERLAREDQALAGRRSSSASARAAVTARIPRVMLIPWSPSPIAESSCVRWSASASMAAADLGHPVVD